MAIRSALFDEIDQITFPLETTPHPFLFSAIICAISVGIAGLVLWLTA